MPQAEAMHGLGDTPGFIFGDRLGSAMVDCAELAASGAPVSKDHQRELPLAVTLPQVWTQGALADRHQSKVSDKPTHHPGGSIR
jgi:hypothetical protein